MSEHKLFVPSDGDLNIVANSDEQLKQLVGILTAANVPHEVGIFRTGEHPSVLVPNTSEHDARMAIDNFVEQTGDEDAGALWFFDYDDEEGEFVQ